MRSVEVLKFKFGEVDIRIGLPRSVREMIARKVARRELAVKSAENSMASSSCAIALICAVLISEATRRQLTNLLSYSLMYKLNNIAIVSPTSIVVTVLLTHPGRGITRSELIAKVRLSSWSLRSANVAGGVAARGNRPPQGQSLASRAQ